MKERIVLKFLMLLIILSAVSFVGCASSQYTDSYVYFSCPHCGAELSDMAPGNYTCHNQNCKKIIVRVDCFHCNTKLVLTGWGWANCPSCSKETAVTYCPVCRDKNHANKSSKYTGYHICPMCSIEYFSTLCPSCKVPVSIKKEWAKTEVSCYSCKTNFIPDTGTK